jgi:hypothetical protein
MEQFNLNKLYYDKDGVKLYGHDMLRLAINSLFIKQRTGIIKFSIWSVIIGFLAFLQSYLLYIYNVKIPSGFISNGSFFIAVLGIMWAVINLIPLLIHSVKYIIFSYSEEFKKRSCGLPTYKTTLKKMSHVEKASLIKLAKAKIMNTPSIYSEFARQHNKLSAVNNAINQTTHKASQTATNMAYTGQQQIYTGFDAINFGNNNNKNNSVI